MKIVPSPDADIMEFGDFVVRDYHNDDLIVEYKGVRIRISPTYQDGMVRITPLGTLTFEPTSVHGLPAFQTRKTI